MVTVAQLTLPAAVFLWIAASRNPFLLDAAQNVGLMLLTLSCGYWLVWHARRAFFNGLVDSKGKAVLITGSDTGFGHMLAKQLARDGFFVFAGCLNGNSDGARALKATDNILVLQMDVTKDEEVSQARQVVDDNLNGRDLWAVVSNAGVAILGYIEWQPMEKVRRVFDVNTLGTLSVTVNFLPLLKKSQGRLVLVSSFFENRHMGWNSSPFAVYLAFRAMGHKWQPWKLEGRMTMPEFVAYCMSKCAVTSLADGLRRQYFNKGLHVCTIEPGAYRTAIADHPRMDEEFDRDLDLLPKRVRKWVNERAVANCKHTAEVLHTSFMRDDLQEVVDAMKMAVRELLPRASYKPGGYLLGLVRWLHNIAPAEMADEVIHAARRLSMLVKRK